MTSSRTSATSVGDPPAIRVEGLTKRYGRRTAVDDLSFRVRPGRVTGFSPVLGVVLLLIVNFAVVPLLSGVWESGVNLTPFGAVGILSRMTHHTTLSVAEAGWVLAAWTAAATLVAVVVERRRDLA